MSEQGYSNDPPPPPFQRSYPLDEREYKDKRGKREKNKETNKTKQFKINKRGIRKR
jgi:hypothetical protein